MVSLSAPFCFLRPTWHVLPAHHLAVWQFGLAAVGAANASVAVATGSAGSAGQQQDVARFIQFMQRLAVMRFGPPRGMFGRTENVQEQEVEAGNT